MLHLQTYLCGQIQSFPHYKGQASNFNFLVSLDSKYTAPRYTFQCPIMICFTIKTENFGPSLRLFYFYLLDYITHRTLILGNQKKKKKNYKSQKMQTGCDNFCFKMLSSKSSNHFKMFKLN